MGIDNIGNSPIDSIGTSGLGPEEEVAPHVDVLPAEASSDPSELQANFEKGAKDFESNCLLLNDLREKGSPPSPKSLLQIAKNIYNAFCSMNNQMKNAPNSTKKEWKSFLNIGNPSLEHAMWRMEAVISDYSSGFEYYQNNPIDKDENVSKLCDSDLPNELSQIGSKILKPDTIPVTLDQFHSINNTIETANAAGQTFINTIYNRLSHGERVNGRALEKTFKPYFENLVNSQKTLITMLGEIVSQLKKCTTKTPADILRSELYNYSHCLELLNKSFEYASKVQFNFEFHNYSIASYCNDLPNSTSSWHLYLSILNHQKNDKSIYLDNPQEIQRKDNKGLHALLAKIQNSDVADMMKDFKHQMKMDS